MKFFRNTSIITKFFLVGITTSLLIAISIIVFFLGMKDDTMRFDDYRNRYAALDTLLSGLYAQGLQTEQATRNILINPTDMKAQKNFLKAGKDFDELFTTISALAKDTPLSSRFDANRKTWDEGMSLKHEIIKLAKQGKIQEATTVLVEQETPNWRDFKETLLGLSTELDNIIMEKTKQMEAARSKTFVIILLVLVGAALVSFAGMSIIALGIRKRIHKILENLQDVAYGEGDLTHRVAVTSGDELGRMAELFNATWDKLERITQETMEQATCIGVFGGQLALESARIMRGSKQIGMQSIAVATASEEMSATADDIACSCSVAAEAAASVNKTATDSAAVLLESVNAMKSIEVKVRQTANNITELGIRSDQIGEIVSTIEDIADQTNLLALNAAIEAARAGEQGRGFAVVADEVRALAERTTKATKEIGAMIKSIQQQTQEAVSSMEQGVHEVERGIADSAHSSEALTTILDKISALTMQVNQIATAAEEQSATTAEIVGNISAVTSSLESFDRTTQLLDSKVDQLHVSSEVLKNSASTFKGQQSPLLMLDTAKMDHIEFVQRIARCLGNKESLQASSLPDHTTCRFGQWYLGKGKEVCATAPSFQKINEPHERIHRLAKEAVNLHNKGASVEAERLLMQVEELSVEIVDYMEKIKHESQFAA